MNSERKCQRVTRQYEFKCKVSTHFTHTNYYPATCLVTNTGKRWLLQNKFKLCWLIMWFLSHTFKVGLWTTVCTLKIPWVCMRVSPLIFFRIWRRRWNESGVWEKVSKTLWPQSRLVRVFKVDSEHTIVMQISYTVYYFEHNALLKNITLFGFFGNVG